MGPLYEEEVIFYDEYQDPSVIGAITYNSNNFKFRDGYYGVYNPRNIQLSESVRTEYLYIISDRNPSPTDDGLDGYEVGIRWLNVADGYEYVCYDNSLGAAVWQVPSGGGGGLEENDHENLDTLTHDIVRNSYDEISYDCYRVGGIVTYTDVSKTTKLRESIVTYGNCGLVSKIEEIQYEGGVEKYRVTEEYTYDGVGRITSVDRTKT